MSDAYQSRDASAKRKRRAADSELRAREAAAKREQRALRPEVREREAACKRRQRDAAPDAARERERAAKAAARAKQFAQPDARFKRDFEDHSFGHSCKVCDRLWVDNNLTLVGSIKNKALQTNALLVLWSTFGNVDVNGAGPFKSYLVCAPCKDSLVGGHVPSMSVTYGYRYSPRPAHLPELNAVEERLISPRLPFLSIRRLTSGNGQYGIKGQVVNVPIGVPSVVQCLPRSVPEDVAIDVHIKRRLVSPASYKGGLVKRSNILAWLKHLENTTLYRGLNVRIDWSRLEQFDGDAATNNDDDDNDDEIEALPETIDLDDSLQVAIALNAVAKSMLYDDEQRY
ncbi:uncharacterized protein LOC144175511 [Haemaphysalis longicornis]